MLGKSVIGVPSVQVAVLVALMLLIAACDFGTPPNPTPLPTYTLYPTFTPYQAPTLDLQAAVEAAVQHRLWEIQAAATLAPTPEPTATPEPTPTPVPTATTILTPTPAPVPTPTPTPIPPPTPTPTPTPSVSQIVDRIRDAVVRIETPAGVGSGTMINSQGYILTNFHVIRGYDTVTVQLEDRYTRYGSVVGYDEEVDLAVVTIDGGPWPFLAVSATRPSVGDELLTLGYALDLPGQSTLTRGLVSAISPDYRLTYIQTDAAISPGNSGGAAITSNGQFIGVPTYVETGGGNVGFLIGLFSVDSEISRLMAGYRLALPTPTPRPMPTQVSTPTLDAVFFFNKGAGYHNEGQFQRAIDQFTLAISIDPKLMDAYLRRGGDYVILGQYVQAIPDYNQAILLDPDNSLAYYGRGAANSGLGLYERAIGDFNQAIRLEPRNAIAYFARGSAYKDLGQYQRAVQDYDQAIRIEPGHASYYYYRSNAYYDLGQYSQALQDIQDAVSLDRANGAYYVTRGLIYSRLGMWDLFYKDQDTACILDINFC